jgi:hypothetical protein
VTVVTDACGYWHKPTADLALRQIGAKGANLITVDELLTRRLDRRHRYKCNGVAQIWPNLNGRLNAPANARRGLPLPPRSGVVERPRARGHDYQI